MSHSTFARVERGKPSRMIGVWKKLNDFVGGRVDQATCVAAVGPEGAMPHIYQVVDDDDRLTLVQKEALNYLMTAAYDAAVQVQEEHVNV